MASPAPRCRDFSVDVAKFLDDPVVLRMSAKALGVYWRLLMNGWRSLPQPGVYPGDHAALKRLAQASDDEWHDAWPEIKDCFRSVGTDLHQRGQIVEWERQTGSVKSASERGRRAIKARWDKAKQDNNKHTDVIPENYPGNTSFLSSSLPLASKEESKKTNTSCVAPSQKDAPLVELPTNRGDDFSIYRETVTELGRLYPAVDVEQALRSMRAWLLSNPSNRKTYRGMMKFVNGWLSREQNRAPRVATAGPEGDERAQSLAKIRAYREKLEAEGGAI